jgi:hypothetical protein
MFSIRSPQRDGPSSDPPRITRLSPYSCLTVHHLRRLPRLFLCRCVALTCPRRHHHGEQYVYVQEHCGVWGSCSLYSVCFVCLCLRRNLRSELRIVTRKYNVEWDYFQAGRRTGDDLSWIRVSIWAELS